MSGKTPGQFHDAMAKKRVILIDDGLWSAIVFECADRDSGAMFVGAANKGYILIEHA